MGSITDWGSNIYPACFSEHGQGGKKKKTKSSELQSELKLYPLCSLFKSFAFLPADWLQSGSAGDTA